MTARPNTLHAQLSRELTETAPVIRAALERLHGRSVLIVSPEDAPVTSGTIQLIDRRDGSALPTLSVEFTFRGLVFALEIQLGRVFDLVASWTGTHFVFRLPSDRFWLNR